MYYFRDVDIKKGYWVYTYKNDSISVVATRLSESAELRDDEKLVAVGEDFKLAKKTINFPPTGMKLFYSNSAGAPPMTYITEDGLTVQANILATGEVYDAVYTDTQYLGVADMSKTFLNKNMGTNLKIIKGDYSKK